MEMVREPAFASSGLSYILESTPGGLFQLSPEFGMARVSISPSSSGH